MPMPGGHSDVDGVPYQPPLRPQGQFRWQLPSLWKAHEACDLLPGYHLQTLPHNPKTSDLYL